jgi:hypothetical protein
MPHTVLDNHNLQAQEDQWWDNSEQYRKYSDLPSLSKWHCRVKPGTQDITLAVDGKFLDFPRQWISITFLLDLQQLSSMAQAAMVSVDPAFSKRLFSNVAFLHQLRTHIIRTRLELQNPKRDWIPPSLERWMRRVLVGLSSEKGEYEALKAVFGEAYGSRISVWKLGNQVSVPCKPTNAL